MPSDTSPLSTHSVRRWRPWRFSLGTLFAAITILGIWLGVIVHRQDRQDRAVEAIRAAGGLVSYDFEIDEDDDFIAYARPPGPTWLRDHFDSTLFCNPVWVDCEANAFDDETAAFLADLPHLTYLALRDATVTDAGMGNLAALASLRELRLVGLDITDKGLESLSELDRLEVLWLIDCRIQGPGLRFLADSPSLRELCLDGCDIDNAALSVIAACSTLEELSLDGTRVDNQAASELAGLKQLKELSLNRTRMTASGVREVRENLLSTLVYGP